MIDFWNRTPALLYGLYFMFGISSNIYALIPLTALSFQNPKRVIHGLLIALVAFCYIQLNYQLPDEEIVGVGRFAISSVGVSKSRFGKRFRYTGKLISLYPEGDNSSIARNIPCTVMSRSGRNRPKGDRDYWIKGKVRKGRWGSYIFIPQKHTQWIPIEKSWSLAETRYLWKKNVTQYINSYILDRHSATFLSGIATGDFQDYQQVTDFARYGLQHLMAISGFHFAIIALILSYFLKMFLPRKMTYWTLILLMSSYFLFLGFNPSIFRAWIAVIVTLMSILIERPSQALNTLGFALLIGLMIDPMMFHHLGFQFSFTVTAAILLFTTPIDQILQRVFPKRPLSQTIAMNTLDQHGYILVSFIRQMMALGGAVNLVAIPMTLFFFQKFPLMSLLYNLFIPFLVSFSMLLLLMSFPFPFLHCINSIYTQFLLNFTHNMPQTLDFVLRSPPISPLFFIGYLTLIYSFGVSISKSRELDYGLTL